MSDSMSNNLFGQIGENCTSLYLKGVKASFVKVGFLYLEKGINLISPDFICPIYHPEGPIKLVSNFGLHAIDSYIPTAVEVKTLTTDYNMHNRVFKKAEKQLSIADYKILHIHCYCDVLFDKVIKFAKDVDISIDTIIFFLDGVAKERIMRQESLQTAKAQPTSPLHKRPDQRLCLDELSQ